MENIASLFSTSGRIGRLKYWAASFLAIAIYIACGAIMEWINPNQETITTGEMFVLVPGFLVGTWINLAACIKRLHDRAKSGFWLLLGLVPIIGDLWLFIELGFLPGTDLFNMYGDEVT